MEAEISIIKMVLHVEVLREAIISWLIKSSKREQGKSKANLSKQLWAEQEHAISF